MKKKKLVVGVLVAVFLALPGIAHAGSWEALCSIYEPGSQYWNLFMCYLL